MKLCECTTLISEITKAFRWLTTVFNTYNKFYFNRSILDGVTINWYHTNAQSEHVVVIFMA